MIYDFNILGFYSVKANRQYDRADNKYVIHHFETNKIPAFQLILDSTITTATYKLFDVDENEIANGSITVQNDVNEAGTNFSRLIQLGTTLSSKEDGFYYIEITYDSTNYIYSDVFCWETDVSEYLKIVATSANMLLGGFELNLAGFTYLVYLDANDPVNEYELEEEGEEKTFGNEPLFNSRNHVRTFEITGYGATLSFLAGLRTVYSNGEVTLTYGGESIGIYDIENTEKKEESEYGDVFLVMDFRFKSADYLQTDNET